MAKLNNLNTYDIGLSYVIDGGSNSNGGYRIGSDGLIEQGGVKNVNATSVTITLPRSFSNALYSLNTAEFYGTGESSNSDVEGVNYNIGVSNKTNSSFRLSKVGERGVSFYARGY